MIRHGAGLGHSDLFGYNMIGDEMFWILVVFVTVMVYAGMALNIT
jgi:hypothetical protein